MKIGFRKNSTNKRRQGPSNLVLLSLLAITAAAVSTANAGACDPALYGTSYEKSDGLATLYTINPTNGTAIPVGGTGFERISAMDVDPTTNTLYAIAERVSDDQTVLISINRFTGAGTLVAEVSFGTSPNFEHIAGMSFDNSGTLYGFGSNDHGFYSIDVSDGTVVRITVNDLGLSGNGIAFSQTGVLYHADASDLHTINKVTGQMQEIAVLTFNFPWDLPKVSAMDYAPDTGLYYAIVKDDNEGESFLATVDVANGNVNSIGATADFIDGFTYYCEQDVKLADIDIEKATNGADADTGTGPNIQVGQPVTWTYVVTNTGQETLNNIAVSDDILGAIACPQTTLAPAADMTCTANGVATSGQYANVGDVVGTPPAGAPVTDSDPSHYLGVDASDEVFKDGFETL